MNASVVIEVKLGQAVVERGDTLELYGIEPDWKGELLVSLLH